MKKPHGLVNHRGKANKTSQTIANPTKHFYYLLKEKPLVVLVP
jgi:hypothetical protein